MDRRSFLTGLGTSLIAAPAIVRAVSLMPVRGIVMAVDPQIVWDRVVSRSIGAIQIDSNTTYAVFYDRSSGAITFKIIHDDEFFQ